MSNDPIRPHLHLLAFELVRLSALSVSCYALASPQAWPIRPRTSYIARFSSQKLAFNGYTIVSLTDSKNDIENWLSRTRYDASHDDRRGVM